MLATVLGSLVCMLGSWVAPDNCILYLYLYFYIFCILYLYVVFYSGVSGLHTCPPLVGQQHEITVSQTIQMQYTQSDMCVLLYRQNTICWYDIQYTYTAGTQTHRYTAKRGVVGVLTYCLLLYYYSGLACQPVCQSTYYYWRVLSQRAEVTA